MAKVFFYLFEEFQTIYSINNNISVYLHFDGNRVYTCRFDN